MAVVQDQTPRTKEDIIQEMVSRGSNVNKAEALSAQERAVPQTAHGPLKYKGAIRFGGLIGANPLASIMQRLCKHRAKGLQASCKGCASTMQRGLHNK